jgi:hypothetical protein
VTISSLTKFTVPLATNQSASAQGLLMPKLKFRFRVSFENFGVSSNKVELTKQVKTFKRPSPTFETFQVHVYNSQVNLLGKPKWEAVTCVLRDDAGGNVSKLVGEQIQKQFDFMEQSSAASGIDYKFVTRLEMLDGGNGSHEPSILETWEMYGCLVSGVEYGDTDYGANEPVEITMTIMMDNAIQTPGGTGIGTDVGRTLGVSVTG